MKKVKFTSPTLYEGVKYEKDGVYELSEKAVVALGSSVWVLEDVPFRAESTAFEAPPRDKMVKKAPRRKSA